MADKGETGKTVRVARLRWPDNLRVAGITGIPAQPEIIYDTVRIDDAEGADAARPKLGRNDPCWCGCGRKYKRCHLR